MSFSSPGNRFEDASTANSLKRKAQFSSRNRGNLVLMNINLTPDLEALVREGIAAGRFQSAEDAVLEALSIWVSGGPALWGTQSEYRIQPGLKLSLLKRQKFTPEGKQARIAASLAALNASQPIDLPIAEWKAIVEEIEDED